MNLSENALGGRSDKKTFSVMVKKITFFSQELRSHFTQGWSVFFNKCFLQLHTPPIQFLSSPKSTFQAFGINTLLYFLFRIYLSFKL